MAGTTTGLTTLLVLVVAVLPKPVQAQRTFTAEYSAEIGAGDAVTLRLEGDVVIRASAGNEVRIATRAAYRGRVYGYANQHPNRAYALLMRREGAGLVIEPEPRKPLLIAGVSTVRETFRTEVHVPPSARLVVRVRGGTVRVVDLLSHVEVETQKGDIVLGYEERALGSLSARASGGTIEVGGHDVGPEFFRTGSGPAVVLLRAQGGRIHINPPLHTRRPE